MSDPRFSSVPTEEPGRHLSKRAKVGLCILLCVLVAVTIVAVVVGVLKGPPAPQHREWHGAGTTPHFSEIVLGRCYTYTQVVRPELRKQLPSTPSPKSSGGREMDVTRELI